MVVLAAHIARITAQRYPARVIPVGLAETITRMGTVAHRLVEAARVEAAATALDHHAAHHARDDAAQLAAALAHVQTVLGEHTTPSRGQWPAVWHAVSAKKLRSWL